MFKWIRNLFRKEPPKPRTLQEAMDYLGRNPQMVTFMKGARDLVLLPDPLLHNRLLNTKPKNPEEATDELH